MNGTSLFGALLCGAMLGAMVAPASAASGTLLGTWRNWSAYVTGTGSAQVCYVLSTPRSTEPRNVKRGPIYFLVNDWPARRVKGEFEAVAGYPYKDGAEVSVIIGNLKIAFFGRNNGDEGDAWIKSLGDNQRLTDAMQKGGSLVVTGASKRGTVTKDSYSLDGFADALAKIHDACKM